MNKKELGNDYFKSGDYKKAIEIYTEILESDELNYQVLSNRSAAYSKIHNYELGLQDGLKATQIKPDWGKAWGRVGAAYYGLNKLDNALISYIKASELEESEIYTNIIKEIKDKLSHDSNKLLEKSLASDIKNTPMATTFSDMFQNVLNNPELMTKLTDPEFQAKILNLQSNPTEAINDSEVMNMMALMMKGIKL